MSTIVATSIIKPPSVFKPDGRFTVFLAGSIEMGKAEDWQTEFQKEFAKYNINILNPRRDDWDSTWEQSINNIDFYGQVDWELKGLALSDLILMYLQPGTLSPISMLELGLFASTGKLVVCCPDGFWRKGNIDIVCEQFNNIICDTKKEFLQIAHNIISRKS